MQINGITIPDQGNTTEYIPDVIGGWLYKVDRTVSVSQLPINYADETIAKLQAQLAEIQTAKDAIDTATVALPAQVQQDIKAQ